jgi:hypothetical protein
MSTGEGKTENSLSARARDLAINVLVFGSAQILLALFFWQVLFRSHLQGFAMGLTLVGFASWAISFMTSFRGTRSRARSPLEATLGSQTREPSADAPQRGNAPARGRLQAQLQGAGCSTVLFLSGLISLGLAFALRVRADMQTGMTWSDIFPTQP